MDPPKYTPLPQDSEKRLDGPGATQTLLPESTNTSPSESAPKNDSQTRETDQKRKGSSLAWGAAGWLAGRLGGRRERSEKAVKPAQPAQYTYTVRSPETMDMPDRTKPNRQSIRLCDHKTFDREELKVILNCKRPFTCEVCSNWRFKLPDGPGQACVTVSASKDTDAQHLQLNRIYLYARRSIHDRDSIFQLSDWLGGEFERVDPEGEQVCPHMNTRDYYYMYQKAAPPLKHRRDHELGITSCDGECGRFVLQCPKFRNGCNTVCWYERSREHDTEDKILFRSRRLLGDLVDAQDSLWLSQIQSEA